MYHSHATLFWLFGAGLLLAGCEASPWQRHFHAEPGITLAPLARETPVVVRQLPWERMEGALKHINDAITGSDTHPAEWPEAKRLEVESVLLKDLQVSEPPGQVTLVGSAVFRSTDEAARDEADLASFARSIGANRVVWASRTLGKSEVVRQEALTTYYTSTEYRWDRRHNTWAAFPRTETATAWVPVRVMVDETGWAAYFLRLSQP